MTPSLRDGARVSLAILMLAGGITHLLGPRPYIQHLPDVVPFRAELVAITGFLEIGLAAGLVGPRRFRRLAGIGVGAFLVLVFPANIYAAVSQAQIDGVPTGWIRWARLPLQVPLIAAALWSTREASRTPQ